jgi:hypothetical protein
MHSLSLMLHSRMGANTAAAGPAKQNIKLGGASVAPDDGGGGCC